MEWLGEAICRSQALSPMVLRNTVRAMSLHVLNRSVDSGELIQGELENCLHWVFTFSSLVLLDKELCWLDDSIIDPKTGAWVSGYCMHMDMDMRCDSCSCSFIFIYKL